MHVANSILQGSNSRQEGSRALFEFGQYAVAYNIPTPAATFCSFSSHTSMKWSAPVSLALAATAVAADFVKVDFDVLEKSALGALQRRDLARREPQAVNIGNQGHWYLAQLYLGLSRQQVLVLLDTGSLDFWVVDKNADCQAPGQGNQCVVYGQFDTQQLTSFKRNDSLPGFSFSYMDDTSVSGNYVQDTVQIGDYVINDYVIALANKTSSPYGVLGIGFSGKVALIKSDFIYPNLPQRLKDDGLIKKNLYSLYLNNINADLGLVLFGAIDTAKIDGELTTVPLVNIYSQLSDKPIEVSLEFTKLTFKGDLEAEVITDNKYVAMLDSGSTNTYLPKPLFQRALLIVGGWTQPNGLSYIECPKDDLLTFTFGFNGANIEVPLEELVIPSLDIEGKCIFTGILPSLNDLAIVGDSVLRHAYLVYDLEDYQISIGKVKYTNDLDIHEVDGALPSALVVELAVTLSTLASYAEATAAAVAYPQGLLTVTWYRDLLAKGNKAMNDTGLILDMVTDGKNSSSAAAATGSGSGSGASGDLLGLAKSTSGASTTAQSTSKGDDAAALATPWMAMLIGLLSMFV